MAFALAVLGARSWVVATVRERAIRPGPEPPTTVRTTVLRMESIAAGLSYHAAVKELRRAELSFRVSGTVESLLDVMGPDGKPHPIHEGDVIPDGASPVRLDPSDYRRERDTAAARLAASEARQAQAAAEADLARLDFGRVDRLARREASTAAELDSARTRDAAARASLKAAEREVDSARIAVAQAEADVSYCELAVPFKSATVAARYVDVGERVTVGQRALLVHDLSAVTIAFGVPDTLVGRVRLGETIDVSTDAAPAERFRGVVYKVAAAADPRTRTYEVEVRVDEPGGLRPGMIATVHLRRETQAALVPLSAVVPRPEGEGCDVFLVVEEGGRLVARRRPIVLADVVDDRVVVRLGEPGGLRLGDRVVVVGVQKLSDGRDVRLED
ncbi:efflux RND transporter periplasmic adaptor subunit [Paludisphaera rhizosphaerae]|uniref:efflux RND transporter periplasmic adaptor subunit n=1 Tax=Paludisphaera rhizosphaerae TaxID=2711216 RepID=UPI0013EA07A6|nr:efflux RND transporter periplasmic adaptor subunit [Paludisphaera rhizosphaerae]